MNRLIYFTTLFSISLLSVTAQNAGQRFKQFDKNSDGKVTRAEAGNPFWFDRLDKNGDGSIEPSELPTGNRSKVSKANKEIAYGEHPQQKLDLYLPEEISKAPVMLFIHGGGWKRGDKSAIHQKASFFNQEGWIFASANYRLLPDGKHPSNAQDVAAAAAWLHNNIAESGGDPDKLFIMGHSAGCHLACLVATDGSHLNLTGKSLSLLKGVIALDTNAYDIPHLLENTSAATYRQVFGEELVKQKEASPLHHVTKGKGIPPILICYSSGIGNRTNPYRSTAANAFGDALTKAGVRNEVIDASDRDHGQINSRFGDPEDEKVTGKALVFLNKILGQTSTTTANSEDRFNRIDRNGDGRITEDELPRPQLFRNFDRNRDGVISRSEIETQMTRPRSAGTGNLKMPDDPGHQELLNIAYHSKDGVDANLLSLDLYLPKTPSDQKHPVMIMIHGGGWRGGDKSNPGMVGAKMRHFVGEGYIYASINYRLSTPENGIIHPIHAEDCARAVAWIHDHIADHGGDPNQLHLMGHSAGGHLAGILGTNERFLEAHKKDLSIIKSNVLLDPAAVDIPGYLEAVNGGGMTKLYQLAFGTAKESHIDASPQDHITAGKNIPPTLLFYGSSRMLLDQFGPAFSTALNKIGSRSQAVDTVTLDHGQISSYIGMLDEPMTDLIMRLHRGDDATKFPSKF